MMLPWELQGRVEAALGRLEHVPACNCGIGRWRLHPGDIPPGGSPSWRMIPPDPGWAASALGPRNAMECVTLYREVSHEDWHCSCEVCGRVYPMDTALGEELSRVVRRVLQLQ
jgi:hypothetical protein